MRNKENNFPLTPMAYSDGHTHFDIPLHSQKYSGHISYPIIFDLTFNDEIFDLEIKRCHGSEKVMVIRRGK